MKEETLKAIIIFVIIILIFSGVSIFKENLIISQSFLTITGNPVGIASVEVLGIASIILTTNSVSFGTINAGGINNTLNNNPYPFVIENDGNVNVNVTISREPTSNPLFNGTGGGDNSSSFQYMPGIEEPNSYNLLCSPSNWTNVPGAIPLIAVCNLKHQNPKDTAQIELKINVPLDEPPGIKSESLIFVASQA